MLTYEIETKLVEMLRGFTYKITCTPAANYLDYKIGTQ